MKRVIPFGIAAFGALVLTAGLTGTAKATTTGCTAGTYAGYCGTQTNEASSPMSFNVSGEQAVYNQPIIAWPNVDNQAMDFFQFAYAGGSSKIFEYAPNGVTSNLCISQPDANAGLVLRTCNGSNWQQFTATASGSGFTWQNRATGQIIDSGPQGTQLRGAPATATPTVYEQWNFAG